MNSCMCVFLKDILYIYKFLFSSLMYSNENTRITSCNQIRPALNNSLTHLICQPFSLFIRACVYMCVWYTYIDAHMYIYIFILCSPIFVIHISKIDFVTSKDENLVNTHTRTYIRMYVNTK